MLNQKLISYFKEQNWWDEEISPTYLESLKLLGVDQNTSFFQFYLHVEDSPYFNGKIREINQLAWFLLNTDLKENLYTINESLGLSYDLISMDSFEGENGFFYNKMTEEVSYIGLSSTGIEIIQKWYNFNQFLEWYFDI